MNTVNIAKIEISEYDGKVYNVEVEPNHPTKDDQFFVQSNTGLVVHNCHPRDNIALRYMAQELNLGYDIFDSIMHAREIQAQNLASELVKQARLHDFTIYIHGKSYKPGVPYLDGSYSLLVGYYCEQEGHLPIYIDPLTGDDYNPDSPGVFLLAHSASITYKYTENSDKTVDRLYCEIPNGSVVVDPWRKYRNDMCKVIHYGNTRPK